MRDLPALDDEVVEVDGRGLLRDPRPRRLPHARGVRRRPRRRVLAARRRRVVRGAARRRRRHPLDGPRDACRGRGRPARRSAPRGWMLAQGTTTFEGSPATGSTAKPSSRRCARSRRPAASRRGSARTRFRRSSTATPTRTSTSRSPRCCPRRRSSPRRRTSSSSAARSTWRRRAGTSRRAARRARAAPPRRPVHGAGRDPARDRARRALGRSPRGNGRRGRARARGERRRRRAAARERALPRPADAAGAGARRCRRRRRARHRLQPGSAFCESLPLCCSLAATQLKLAPAEALAACTVNAAHVLGRADRLGRLAPGLPRRRRAARRTRLALPRVSPRRRRSSTQVVGRRRATLEPHAVEETAAPRGEVEAARVRVRLRRRRGERARASVPEGSRRAKERRAQRLEAAAAAKREARAAARQPAGRAPSRRRGTARSSAPRCSASSSSSSSRSRPKGAIIGDRRPARASLYTAALRPVHVRSTASPTGAGRCGSRRRGHAAKKRYAAVAAVVALAGPRREQQQDARAAVVATECRSSGSKRKSVAGAGVDRLAARLDPHAAVDDERGARPPSPGARRAPGPARADQDDAALAVLRVEHDRRARAVRRLDLVEVPVLHGATRVPARVHAPLHSPT